MRANFSLTPTSSGPDRVGDGEPHHPAYGPVPTAAANAQVDGGPDYAYANLGETEDQINVGSAQTFYDPGYPGQITSPNQHIIFQGDVIGDTTQDVPYSVAGHSIVRYIDPATGGTTGVSDKNGYTTGINQNWRAPQFTGRTKRFVTRDLAKDTGPVGRSNHLGFLQAGVASQYAIPTSVEEIYRSMVGGLNNGG